jgi:transcriptional antiterminator NusG
MTDNNVTTDDQPAPPDGAGSDEERLDSNATAADPEFDSYERDAEAAPDQPSAGEPEPAPVDPQSTFAVASDGAAEGTDAATAEVTTAVDVIDETTEPEAVEEEEEEEEPDYFFAPGDWYVVHTYAGYENKVKANLASRIQSMNMEDKIYDVIVPTEEVMELKSGKMQAVQKKVFPGYILVRMELDDDSWYVVRNTPGVTGFVGSGAKPTPLDTLEVSKILAPKTEDRPKPKLEYEVGEVVSVIGGPFAGYSGPVNAIDVDRQIVRVLLDLFGRETPVDLTFDQVTKL